MGVVYRAFDEKLQRTVAIKLVGRDSGSTPSDRTRLIEEARAASGLNHPHICTVYETGEIDGQPFIAMEFVEGRPLSEQIPADGLPLAAVVRYGTQIADALAHAHSRGVVHRDLKTANVVVTGDGRAKVLDFGLARRIPTDIATTVTRSSDAVATPGLIGTLSYMAPEVLAGDAADERSDLWALGVVLYEMAAGELPFKGRTEFDLTATILRAPAQPFPAHVPPMLRAIVQRCLTKEPGQRYQLAVEVRAALEAIQSDVIASPAPGRLDPPRVWTGRRGILAGAAALVAIAAAVGTWLWSKDDHPGSWERVATGGRLTLAVASERPVFDPAISPDGKMLVYGVEDGDGGSDLFVRRVAGGALVQLTKDDAREGVPRFSPDSEWIAFSRRETSEDAPDVRIIPALGGAPVSIISRATAAVWSPDGSKVAFLRRLAGGDQELVTAARDGSNEQVVLKSDSAYPFLRHPAWAPDGHELAIIRGSGGIAGEIWFVPTSGGAPRLGVSDPSEVFSESPIFTPDGHGLIHSSNRGGATNIWYYPLRGGVPVRLTAGPGPDTYPTIAADGTVAFINSRWRNTLDLHSLRGDPPRTLTTHTPYLWAPAFSPDGREVSFSRAEVDGSWHVWSMGLDGGTPRRVTSAPAGELYPRYSPDGRSILFHTWGTPRRIGTVAREGGAPRMIDFGESSVGFPDPSPDGTRLALTRTDADAERIYIAPAGGGPLRALTTSPGSVPRWSPDGRFIAFGGNRGYTAGVFVIAADGSNQRRLVDTGGWPVWWPDGKQIGYRVIGRTGSQEIHVTPLNGGPTRTLTTIRFNGSNQPFDVSPDGTRVVTSNALHVSDEIWLMEPRARQ